MAEDVKAKDPDTKRVMELLANARRRGDRIIASMPTLDAPRHRLEFVELTQDKKKNKES